MTKYRAIDKGGKTLGYVMAESPWHAKALALHLYSKTQKVKKS